ncbi:MAG: serine/threonine-protein phosphatase [Deltaproteobacteria bacterium]|nr:serine/threonine-protein phosphatase [Deltaproteobacteria bacterium]
MDSLHLRAGTVTFAAAALAMAGLGAAAVALRGDRATRLAVASIAGAVLIWATTAAFAASVDDPAAALALIRIGNAPIAWVGPSLLLLLLSVSGRIDGNRAVLVIAAVVAAVSTVIALVTPLNERDVQATSFGYYGVAGALHVVHVGQLAVWGAIGQLLSRRGQRSMRDRARVLSIRAASLLVVLALLASGDLLVEYQLVGLVPIAWLPVTLAGVGGAYVLWRTNQLRNESIDVPAVVELVAAVIGAGAVVAIASATRGTEADRPFALAAMTAPVPVIVWLIGRALRQRGPVAPIGDDAERALLEFADAVQAASDEHEVAGGFAELVQDQLGAGTVRVWRATGESFTCCLTGEPPPPPLDARVRAWMVANRAPLFSGDIATLRLGGLRALVEAYVAAHDAEVVVPLVDREALVGLSTISIADGRGIAPESRALIAEAAQVTAQAMTFTALRKDAMARAETAREVEVAEAVQGARAVGAVAIEVGSWRLGVCYRPAAKVASDVWTWAALPGGDALLVVGDVVGRGVSAALVSSAVVGAVEAAAAVLGARLTPEALLALLDETVVAVAGPGAALGAFAVIVGGGRARWAAAGHRGGYRVRPREGERRADIHALTARGNALGDPARVIGSGEAPFADGDALVLVSDGAIDVADAHGQCWGERRLLRALRTWMPADDRAAEELVAAAVAHGGEGVALPDDVVVMVARPRALADA